MWKRKLPGRKDIYGKEILPNKILKVFILRLKIIAFYIKFWEIFQIYIILDVSILGTIKYF